MTIDPVSLQALRQEMILGRPGDPQSLQQLALAAMMSRFSRAAPPGWAITPAVDLPPARYPGGAARRAMLRLLSGRDGTVSDSMAAAVPVLLAQHGLELHPFDFARLETFIARFAGQLSPAARSWLRIIRPERDSPEEPYVEGPVTEDRLAQASKAQRIAFLRGLRANDPARARGVIESMMPDDSAEMRQRMLRLLEDRLTSDDIPFLESLLKDRAASVRDMAAQLLGRIPGTESFARMTARLKEDLQVRSEGLLRRRKILVYKGLVTRSGHDRFSAMLSGLRLADIAAALGETEATLLAAAMQSDALQDLPLLLVRKAVEEENFSLIQKACEQLGGHDGVLMRVLIGDDFAERSAAARSAILGLCFTPSAWKELPDPLVMTEIAGRIPPALPDGAARALLAHPAWAGLDERAARLHAEAIAHLVPPSLSAAFVELVQDHAPRAVLFHRFIQSLASEEKP